MNVKVSANERRLRVKRGKEEKRKGGKRKEGGGRMVGLTDSLLEPVHEEMVVSFC